MANWISDYTSPCSLCGSYDCAGGCENKPVWPSVSSEPSAADKEKERVEKIKRREAVTILRSAILAVKKGEIKVSIRKKEGCSFTGGGSFSWYECRFLYGNWRFVYRTMQVAYPDVLDRFSEELLDTLHVGEVQLENGDIPKTFLTHLKKTLEDHDASQGRRRSKREVK